ncbi:MAG: caspase family protein [Bacteroidales bacterium]|nr:MAG: caspase family protein [Bacteroidales bacterium]
MKNHLLKLALVIVALSLNACATMFNTTRQKVSFSSNPSGAEVFINNKSTGKTTPCNIWVTRKVQRGETNSKNQYIYEFKKDGFVPYTYTDNAKVSGKIYLNLLLNLAAIPGFGIDFISGGAYTYNNDVLATMQKETGYVVIRDTVVKQQIVYVQSPENKGYVFEKLSDVDKDIPKNSTENPYRFALIIGNEDYSSKQNQLNDEINVEFARNDASAFKEYAISVLGIPEQNITMLLDATTGQMSQALSRINLIVKNTKGKGEFFIYYAGHGLPDEVTREPYIIPVDISGQNAKDGIKLQDMYAKLTEFPSKRMVVFIDACFSGGARNKALLAARGVKVRPAEGIIPGNIAILSATSDDQSALPFKDKNHGFFTYYLLKKLKETKGDITFKELSDYLTDIVPLQSVLLNNKEQTPTVKMGMNITEDLNGWNFVKQ